MNDEIVTLEKIDADAARAADQGIDYKTAMQAWPEHARLQWLMRYYQRVESNLSMKKEAA